MHVDPVKRGKHIVNLRREVRLTTQAIVGSDDREASGDDPVERALLRDERRKDSPAPDAPPAAVKLEHNGYRPRVSRQMQIERHGSIARVHAEWHIANLSC
ncbi:hypothetical protein GCM10009563_32930 [Subtercola frigoramans]